jgi:tetratricopeptide (TPR) repeat protein
MAHSPPLAGGDAAAEDSDVSATIRRYEERLARAPDSLAFARLADAYRKAGRTPEAIRLCRNGLERFPGYVTGRLILAKALLDSGDPESALAEVRAILEREPTEAPAHRLAAELLRRAGQLDLALSHLRQAVAVDPSDRESRVLIEVLEGSGRSPGGSSLERLLDGETFATMSFAVVCLEQGLVDEAAQICLRILRKDPSHAAARARLDEALRIKTQRRKGS